MHDTQEHTRYITLTTHTAALQWRPPVSPRVRVVSLIYKSDIAATVCIRHVSDV